MDKLNAFFSLEHAATRVVGTYLFPHRLLGAPDWHDRHSATRVIATVETDLGPLMLTRNGGFFMEPPPDLSDWRRMPAGGRPSDDFERKLLFQDALAAVVNELICEFALCGVVSEPASPVHLSAGRMIDGHALITGAGGGRELYTERTIAPSLLLLNGLWSNVLQVPDDYVTKARQRVVASKLAEVSRSLPTLVAGAYSLVSRQQNGEAVLDAWIVTEQLVDWVWSRHVAAIQDERRRRRLEDTRTYSAAVRIEVLEQAGALPSALCVVMHVARKHRNDLAHRAVSDWRAALDTADCMRQTIEFVTATSVARPQTARGLTW